ARRPLRAGRRLCRSRVQPLRRRLPAALRAARRRLRPPPPCSRGRSRRSSPPPPRPSARAAFERPSPKDSLESRPRAERGLMSMLRLQKILVPTDFSDSARHAFDYGHAFARDYGAELILLHVVEAVPVGYASDLFPVPAAEMYQEVSAYAQAELEKLSSEASGSGVAARTRVVQGKPSAEIVRIAAEETVDLIVLGTHGKGM